MEIDPLGSGSGGRSPLPSLQTAIQSVKTESVLNPLLWIDALLFRTAYDHFKAKEYRDCAVDANNALESTMKAICEAKGWEVQKGARASDLLKILSRNKLFPEFADQSFEQLLSTLKSGLPTLRNETGGHGQGSEPVEVPEYVAAYALHLAASKIRFLFEAFIVSENKNGRSSTAAGIISSQHG